MQYLKALLDVLTGLLTPLIAVITVYIAWQQRQADERRIVSDRQAEERRLILDRYDRRLRIYARTVEFMSLACRDFKPEFGQIVDFQRDVAEADFLFGPEISAYLNQLARRALESQSAHAEYCDSTMAPPADYDHNAVTARMHEHSLWLTEQWDVAREKFREYLDLSK